MFDYIVLASRAFVYTQMQTWGNNPQSPLEKNNKT